MTSADERQRHADDVVRAMLQKDNFSRWLGIEVIELTESASTCRMTVREEMVNAFGVAHGAIAFALADSAFAFACNTSGTVTVAIENSIAYPAPVYPGDVLTAVASEEASSRRLGYYRAEVRNQRNELVALFRGTAFRTGRSLGAM